MSTRPLLNQREAAAACGVSRTTIRRRREAGDLPGAVQDPQRGWLIPVEDLLAAGFRLHAPAGPDEVTAVMPAGPDPGVVADPEDGAGLRAELDRVRHEHALALATAEHGRQLAKAEAQLLRDQLDARAEHIADLQQALRALTAGQERAVLQPSPSVPGQAHPVGGGNEPVPPLTQAPVLGPGAVGEAAEQRRWWRRT
ncbi:helix-turn-helix transcriptional regulator [Streptomyces sp. NPDC005576]|uniref:helix-turn-helix transcriptional regulator n=1 Tax=Streptomyces sp. NPDC005576 TaxID=3364726 RepID=UPI0036BD1931